MEHYDLIVIGGGIQGAGIARDAALRGLRVALFERGDLGGGTSSHTSRLVHGGLRYLEGLRFSLVKEALAERALLLRLAPHLVWPTPFLVPTYKKDRRPWWYVEAGLRLYDGLAGSKRLGPTKRYSSRKALELEPDLPRADLRGAGLFFDAQMDDARVCLENALDAAALGADLYVHHEVVSIAREGEGCVVRAQDRVEDSSDAVEAHAPAVVNASGPWADAVRGLAVGGRRKTLRPSRGTHIVVPTLTQTHALVLTALQDGRVIFVLPAPGGSLVGTTEAEHKGPPDEVAPTVQEARYLREEVRRRWPASVRYPEHVRRAFAGLRPLARSGGSLGSLSRESRLVIERNLFTVVGGKYTTYRAISERVLDRVLSRLGKTARPCSTRERPLPGAGAGTREEAAAAARTRALDLQHLGNDDADRLGPRYGGLFGGAAVLVEQFHRVHEKSGTRILEGEVVYAVRHEMARRLEDVLLRRLGLWSDRQAIRQAAVPVSLWMAEHLGWSRARTSEEVQRVEQALDVEERILAGALQA